IEYFNITVKNVERRPPVCREESVYTPEGFFLDYDDCHSLRGDKERESRESYSVTIGILQRKKN
ncbi:MAG: hypothetical protein ACRC4N_05395, partial [Gammaproteobacteria bacterium]